MMNRNLASTLVVLLGASLGFPATPIAQGSAPTGGASSPAAAPRAVVTVPGMPEVRDPTNLYGEVAANRFSPNVSGALERVYVPNRVDNSVSVIDASSNTVISTPMVGTGPNGVAVHPSGSRVYVANTGSDSISVIDAASNTVAATVNLPGSGPIGVTVKP